MRSLIRRVFDFRCSGVEKAVGVSLIEVGLDLREADGDALSVQGPSPTA